MDANRIHTGRPPAALSAPGGASTPAAPGPAPAPTAARVRVPVANVTPYAQRRPLNAQAAVTASRPPRVPLMRINVKLLPANQVAPPRHGLPDSGPAVRVLLFPRQAQLLSRIQDAPANTPQERLRLLKSLLAQGMLTPESARPMMTMLVKKIGLENVRDELLAPLIYAESRGAIPRGSLEASFDTLLDLRHSQVQAQRKGVTVGEVRAWAAAIAAGMNLQRPGDEPAQASGLHVIGLLARRMTPRSSEAAMKQTKALIAQTLPRSLHAQARQAFDKSVTAARGISIFSQPDWR